MDSIIDFFRENYAIITEITGLILGLGYLYYEYKASKAVWIFAILMPCISMSVYFSRGIYADFGINIYYLITAIYGFIVWHRGGNSKKGVPISVASRQTILGCVCATLIFWVGIYFILVNFTNSNVPIPDAFTTALSMVASWMLARKYTQQWIAWLIVDAVSVGLFIYKGIYFYAALYSIYTVIAWFGYRKWVRIMHGYQAE